MKQVSRDSLEISCSGMVLFMCMVAVILRKRAWRGVCYDITAAGFEACWVVGIEMFHSAIRIICCYKDTALKLFSLDCGGALESYESGSHDIRGRILEGGIDFAHTFGFDASRLERRARLAAGEEESDEDCAIEDEVESCESVLCAENEEVNAIPLHESMLR